MVVLILLTPGAAICGKVAKRLRRGAGPATVVPGNDGQTAPADSTPSVSQLIGPSGAVLILLFLCEAALMYFAGLHEASTAIHKATYAALFATSAIMPMIIVYRAQEIARQGARKRRNEHEEGTGLWSRFKAKTKPISFGGKYFVVLLLIVESVEVVTRAASIAMGAARQSNKLTTFVTLALGTNLVVTPLLLWRKMILQLMFFDIVRNLGSRRVRAAAVLHTSNMPHLDVG